MSTVPDFIRSDRFATTVFVACVLAAIPVLMLLGSEEWFRGDDWAFLSGRAFTIDGFLHNHSGHWVSLPFIAFRAIYPLFGLHSYAPYQLLAILSHVSIVVLGYWVMRRMSVQPWLATAVASTFLLFGAGAFNIFTAFQITLNGSIVCGLGFLLLVDHDGPPDWRNVFGIVVAIIGLTTSALMVPMIAGVFTALLLRRGPVVAVSHIASPALVFLLWYLAYGTSQPEARGTPGQSLEMFVRMTTETLEAIGQNRIVGGILGVVIVFGLCCASREVLRERNGAALAFPAALVVAWLGFCAAASLRAGGLSNNPDLPASERYVHVGAAFLLPLIAYGGCHLARIRSLLALVPVAALALGVPGNIDKLVNYVFPKPNSEIVLAVANSDLLDQLPGDYRPFAYMYNSTTVDWLRSARANGDIPNVVDGVDQLSADRRLALRQDRSADATCVPKRGRLIVTAHVGDIIKIGTRRIQVSLINGHARSRPVLYRRYYGNIVIRAGPVDLEILGEGDAKPRVCIERQG